MNDDVFAHGGNLYAALRQKGGALTDLLDFSANINPLGMPDSVRQAVISALGDAIHYPDAEAAALKTAISRRYAVDPKLITVGNGAAELLYVLCHMLRPRRVLIPAPTFSEYERAARASGSAVDYLYLNAADNFSIDPGRLIDCIEAADIVFWGNPNNPTGQLLTRAALEPVIAAAHRCNCLAVVDESFLDFLTEDEAYTCRPLLSGYPNLLILQSLTKFYAIPGLRLGFMLADAAIGKLLDTGKDPWNVNSLAQAAGVAALADEGYRAASIAAIAAARDTMLAGIKQLSGFAPLPGAANFLLVDISGTGRRAPELRQAMLARNILIRDCSNFPGLSDRYIRLAVKLPQQNELLLNTFAKIL
jgi:threonine-phosphate decarboxylase